MPTSDKEDTEQAALIGITETGILYGSFARGEDIPESDIEFLDVLPGLENFWTEFKKLSEVANELSLAYGTVISAIPVRRAEYTSGMDPLLRNVRKEGIV